MKNNITKFLINTITKEELKELYKWLENPENQTKFEAYISNYHDLNMATLKNDVDKAYLKVKHSIDSKSYDKKVIPFYKNKFVKYAAAVLILVTSGYFFVNKNNIEVKETIVVSDIKPGTDKAVLTLANGSEIFLDSVTSYHDTKVTSDGKEIIYSKSKNEAKEIEFNYLTIPRGGQYHVILSDGTEVWLNSESQLKYPVSFIEGNPRMVELVYGEAYLEVTKSTEHNGDKFVITTNGQNITVLGTKFNVKAYKDETEILTTLVEGSVSISTKYGTKLLVPNKQSVFSLENDNLSIQYVDVKSEIAWIRGEFIFQKKSLKDIARVLGRWYNIDFEFLNDSIAEQKFNGELKKSQNLETILKLIQNTNKIKTYEMKENSVFLK